MCCNDDEKTQAKIPPHSEPVSLAAGIDWLTVTAVSLDKQRGLYEECKRAIEAIEVQGVKVKKWRFCGYAGLQCGGIRWGTREDSGIAVLSGQDARINWLALLCQAENVTRVDLAVTVELPEPLEGLAQIYYDWLTGEGKELVDRRIAYTLIKGSDQGQTLYIGSRISDQYGRIYDKGIEDKSLKAPPGRVWRYEVEFKRERAISVARRLAQQGHPDQINQSIATTTWIWFDVRHIPPIWRKNGRPVATRIEARISSDEMTLRWLSTQVSPSVKDLIKRGKGEDVFIALDILPNILDLSHPLDKEME